MTSKSGLEFKVGDAVVYPAHGVGKVAAIETQEVAGMSLEVYVVTFDHEKMTLRVPTKKAVTAGLRTLAADDTVTKALTTLKGRARVKRKDEVVYEGKIQTLRRFQNEAAEVREGQECGIVLDRFSDILEGDVIESYEIEKVAQEL